MSARCVFLCIAFGIIYFLFIPSVSILPGGSLPLRGYVPYAATPSAFILVSSASMAWAQDGHYLYQSESLDVSWPPDVEKISCPDNIQAKAGDACAQIGPDGHRGTVFFNIHSGYALGTRQALENHLNESESALSGIPHVHVMQSRVVGVNPLVGMMELIRRDDAIAELLQLKSPLRQTSFLYPFEDKLAQVFLYIPMDETDEGILKIYEQCVEAFSHPVIRHPGAEPTDAEESSQTNGTLSLLPGALLMGGAIALAVILGMIWVGRIRQRRKGTL